MELDFRKDPALLAQLVDVMADGLFTVDRHGCFVGWSRGAEQITGYLPDDVVGRPCKILEGPNCKGFGRLADLLRDPSPPPSGLCQQECKVQAKNGREIFIHGNVRLLFDPDGNTVGAVGSFSDVSSLVHANERIAMLEEQSQVRGAFEKLVGTSPAMQEVFRRLKLAAESDVNVFVTGESGTGKELAAQAIHSQSGRNQHAFIAVNCSAIPETLLESELFGHVRGSFSGAVKDKVGMFQSADKGTLFLDEIGDISPLLQLKLLRVLQERELRRVGDEISRKVDVRLITATNRNLKDLISTSQFREDFFYRIHVFEIVMPPLRQRREDIPLLVQRFMSDFSKLYENDVHGIARDAMQRLIEHSWPGNVRELRNAIEHAFVTVKGDTISLLDLPLEVRDAPPHDSITAKSPFVTRSETAEPSTQISSPPPHSSAKPSPLSELTPTQQADRQRVAAALEQTQGNKTAAAKQLGVSRVTMWKKCRKYGL